MMKPVRQNDSAGWMARQAVRGFTLAEILVVIAVIAIMAALLIPALSQAKEQARMALCRSNMRQVGLGFLMYADDNRDYLPWPGGEPTRANYDSRYLPDWCVGGQNSIPTEPSLLSQPGFGFNADAGAIFPYVSSQPRQPYDPTNKSTYAMYRCPSTGKVGEALRVNFAANGYLDPGKPYGSGRVPPKGVMLSRVLDPAQKVLLVNMDPNQMMACAFVPNGLITSPFVMHVNRVNIAFLDGHMQGVPSRLLNTMLGSDSEQYFNVGKE